jgi:hypothetical protein
MQGASADCKSVHVWFDSNCSHWSKPIPDQLRQRTKRVHKVDQPFNTRRFGMSKRPFIVTYGSDLMPHKTVRAKVKQLLRKLIEPEPRYRTGKMWND